jgi:pimeloyl-ACP methyl ester carboxylesterase
MACSALPEDLTISTLVEVKETAHYIRLMPKNENQATTGIVFYPGGLVDAHAYIAPLQELVAEGYPVLIIKVTGNLAIFDAGKAAQFREQLPVERWIIGGHSLGGVIASYDVRDAPSAYAGLFIWASFSGEAADLSNWEGAVLSLSGEKDGLTLATDIEENKAYLPSPIVVQDIASFPTASTRGNTIYHEIQGGNHAQFGSYGEQNGDGVATISKQEQQDQIITFMRAFLQANQW